MPGPGPAAGHPASESDTHIGSVLRPAKSRVLVLDDNRDHLSVLATLLRALGQEVQVASTGQAALWLARAFQPHVALLDLAMPHMSGYEVATELRRIAGTQVRIVAISGMRSESRERALAAGFDLFIQKPASVGQILAALER